jgi:hypothetical protein
VAVILNLEDKEYFLLLDLVTQISICGTGIMHIFYVVHKNVDAVFLSVLYICYWLVGFLCCGLVVFLSGLRANVNFFYTSCRANTASLT